MAGLVDGSIKVVLAGRSGGEPFCRALRVLRPLLPVAVLGLSFPLLFSLLDGPLLQFTWLSAREEPLLLQRQNLPPLTIFPS